MDTDIIPILKDIQSSIEKSFEKIQNKIKSYDNMIKNDKKTAKYFIQKELKLIKNNISQIEQEINNLKEEENKNEWEEIVNKLDSKNKEYKEKFNNLDSNNNVNEEEKDGDYLDPDAEVDLDKMNAEQAMKRGDKILDVDDKALDNMGQIVNKDVDDMKGVNIKLNEQIEKFDKVDSDLKEMDFSIGRARKKLTNMFKLYASDKCITCMIISIVIIIVVIIIVSVCGGDNKNNFNVPHDIFGTNKNSTSNYGNNLNKSFHFMNIIIILALYLL